MPVDDRPNILLIMSDEHAPMFSGPYGHPLVQTPHLDRLDAEGVVFENAYCNSPLCTPSRMSFMTGQYAHHISAWDNATPLGSDAVTWPHRLRAAGYDVVLSGKQHFYGPDQLHGFRQQLARDLHAEWHHPVFDWSQGTQQAPQPWGALCRAGPGITEEIRVDDQAEAAAVSYLEESSRQNQPWALNVSFIAPHFPFIVPQRFWDLYTEDGVDIPAIPAGHLNEQHPVYQRLRRMFGMIEFPEELVRRARVGYYGLITYLDEKIGRLLDTLEATGQRDNTLVAYFSDHGEMAGEHGMWRKSNFYEQSVRVPLQLSWPSCLPSGKRVEGVTSLVDLVATIIEVSGASPKGMLDGNSILALAQGEASSWKNEAFSEYLAHGVARPMAMLRRGQYKLNYSLGDPVELYDLGQDPGEFHDLGSDPRYESVRDGLREQLLSHWDPVELEKRVRQSQQDRIIVRAAETGEADEASSQKQWYAVDSSGGPPN